MNTSTYVLFNTIDTINYEILNQDTLRFNTFYEFRGMSSYDIKSKNTFIRIN